MAVFLLDLFLGTVIIAMSRVVAGMAAVALMKLFRLLEFMALAGNTKHAEREGNQGKFHRATSIAARRPNAIPKVEISGKPSRHHPGRPFMGSQFAKFRRGFRKPDLQRRSGRRIFQKPHQ